MVPVNLEKTLKYCFNLFPEIMFFEYDLRKDKNISKSFVFFFHIFSLEYSTWWSFRLYFL